LPSRTEPAHTCDLAPDNCISNVYGLVQQCRDTGGYSVTHRDLQVESINWK